MHLIDHYDLFLFDFDGLLVNTELLHYFAYKNMCKNRGFDLHWSFEKYIKTAHYRSEGLAKQIYTEFPDLQQMEPNWSVLYQEKKAALIKVYQNEEIALMPGVKTFISLLSQADKKLAVVTNSDHDLVSIIKEKNPVLATIPHWITREQYINAKPDPECYLKAIELLAESTDHIIGFEDTPRGLQSLMGTRAKPILITPMNYPELPLLIESGALHFTSFESLIAAYELDRCGSNHL